VEAITKGRRIQFEDSESEILGRKFVVGKSAIDDHHGRKLNAQRSPRTLVRY